MSSWTLTITKGSLHYWAYYDDSVVADDDAFIGQVMQSLLHTISIINRTRA